MPTPKHSIIFYDVPYSGTSIAVGNVVIPTTDSTAWLVSTTGNRGARRSEAIAIGVSSITGQQTLEFQQTGTVDPSITGLGTSTGWVRASATGSAEVFTPAFGGTSDVIGYADNGRLHLAFGFLTETIIQAAAAVAPFNVGSAPFPSNGLGFNWGVADDVGQTNLLAIRSANIGSNKNLIGISTTTGATPAVAIQFGFNTAGAGDIRSYLLGDTVLIQGADDALVMPSSYFSGANYAGSYITRRLAVGTNVLSGPTSQFAPFSTSGLNTGPFIQLFNCSTLPTGNPDSAFGNDKKAIRIILDLSVPSLKFWWPDGTITQLPKFNGTLPTVGGPTLPTGSAFWHSTAGALDAATKKVDLTASADVTVPGTANGVVTSSGTVLQQATRVLATTDLLQIGTNPAATSAIGIPNNVGIYARNNANNADIRMAKVTTGDVVTLGPTDCVQSQTNQWTLTDSTAASLVGTAGSATWSGLTALNMSGYIIGFFSAWGSVNATGTQAMADANQTPAAAVYQCTLIKTTGATTANRNLTIPSATDAQGYMKWINNTCTNANNIVVTTGAGTTVSVANGKTAAVWVDSRGVTRLTADV